MAFLKSGNIYMVASYKSLDLHDALPPNNFVVKFNRTTGEYYLQEIENFSKPMSQIFGDMEKKRDRIYNTFLSRQQTTGVLLLGEKGSGKSLLAKLLSIKAAHDNIPTIVVNSSFYGEVFNTFIQGIEQPCVVLFDEFEKVYSNRSNSDHETPQEQVLTLLDGVYPGRKLFVLTCNNDALINFHLINRPGRIFYKIDFFGLDEAFVNEYCRAKLNDERHLQRVVTITRLFSNFNFDMLQALVEEMNRYNESPDEALKLLNIKENSGGDTKHSYSIDLSLDGIPVQKSELANQVWTGHLLSSNFFIETEIDGNTEYHQFGLVDLTDLDIKLHRYVFEKDNKKLILTRQTKERKALLEMIV